MGKAVYVIGLFLLTIAVGALLLAQSLQKSDDGKLTDLTLLDQRQQALGEQQLLLRRKNEDLRRELAMTIATAEREARLRELKKELSAVTTSETFAPAESLAALQTKNEARLQALEQLSKRVTSSKTTTTTPHQVTAAS